MNKKKDPNANNYLNPDPNVTRPAFQELVLIRFRLRFKDTFEKFYYQFYKSVPYLSEDEAKAALAQFVSEHCCYGKGPAKELTFTNLQSSSSYRVVKTHVFV